MLRHDRVAAVGRAVPAAADRRRFMLGAGSRGRVHPVRASRSSCIGVIAVRRSACSANTSAASTRRCARGRAISCRRSSNSATAARRSTSRARKPCRRSPWCSARNQGDDRAPSSSPITTSACAACRCCSRTASRSPLVVTHEDSPGENDLVRAAWRDVAARARHRRRSRPPIRTRRTSSTRVAALAPGLHLLVLLPAACWRATLLATARRAARSTCTARCCRSIAAARRSTGPSCTARRETGATLHYMTDKPDAGDIVAQTAVPILPDDTAGDVFDKVTVAAEHDALARAARAARGRRRRACRRTSPHGSYFGGRKPEDGRIDWSQPAPARSTTWSAPSRRPIPARSPTLGGRARHRRARRVLDADSGTPAIAGRRFDVDRSAHCPRAVAAADNALLGVVRAIDARSPIARIAAQIASGSAAPARRRIGVVRSRRLRPTHSIRSSSMKKVLILGVNGFIGHHLSQAHPRRRPTGRSTAWTCRPTASPTC